MKNIYLLLFVLSPFLVLAQAELNDPQAAQLLEQISNQYKNASSLHSDFTLTIQLPEMAEEVQNGKVFQMDKKIHVVLDQNEIISNGDNVYIIMKDQNVAQLHNYSVLEQEGKMMNPFAMLDIYKSDEYVYGIVGTETIENKNYTAIEFKPNDRYSEYSKVRVTIDEKLKQPKYIKVFVKDGSQYILSIDNVKIGDSIPANEFEFNKSDYPNIQLEDLRI